MERKQMARDIAERFNTTAKYLGPPSFAFEITTEHETFTIDRQGVITTSTGEVVELDEILCPKDSIEVTLPINGYSEKSLQNIINMVSAKQELIKKAFSTTSDFMDKDYAKDLSFEKTDTLEEFVSTVSKLGGRRCPGIVFDFDEETITIKLRGVEPEGEKAKAFMEMCSAMAGYAKQLKHSSYKPSQDDNPKYAMRTWLIRLGMAGDEYKQTRKILLSNLEGSGAYRKAGSENG